MLKAKDPKSGLMVEPNPGGRAECQFCAAVVIAKCGEILGWHWSHYAHESCQEWEEASENENRRRRAWEKSRLPARRLCNSCAYNGQRCRSRNYDGHVWFASWGDESTWDKAPQCPAWRLIQPVRDYKEPTFAELLQLKATDPNQWFRVELLTALAIDRGRFIRAGANLLGRIHARRPGIVHVQMNGMEWPTSIEHVALLDEMD